MPDIVIIALAVLAVVAAVLFVWASIHAAQVRRLDRMQPIMQQQQDVLVRQQRALMDLHALVRDLHQQVQALDPTRSH